MLTSEDAHKYDEKFCVVGCKQIQPASTRSIDGSNVFRSRTLVTGRKGELNTLTFVQCFESIASNLSIVHKYIISTFLLNKAKAFSLIEPFNGSIMSFRHELLH